MGLRSVSISIDRTVYLAKVVPSNNIVTKVYACDTSEPTCNPPPAPPPHVSSPHGGTPDNTFSAPGSPNGPSSSGGSPAGSGGATHSAVDQGNNVKSGGKGKHNNGTTPPNTNSVKSGPNTGSLKQTGPLSASQPSTSAHPAPFQMGRGYEGDIAGNSFRTVLTSPIGNATQCAGPDASFFKCLPSASPPAPSYFAGPVGKVNYNPVCDEPNLVAFGDCGPPRLNGGTEGPGGPGPDNPPCLGHCGGGGGGLPGTCSNPNQTWNPMQQKCVDIQCFRAGFQFDQYGLCVPVPQPPRPPAINYDASDQYCDTPDTGLKGKACYDELFYCSYGYSNDPSLGGDGCGGYNPYPLPDYCHYSPQWGIICNPPPTDVPPPAAPPSPPPTGTAPPTTPQQSPPPCQLLPSGPTCGPLPLCGVDLSSGSVNCQHGDRCPQPSSSCSYPSRAGSFCDFQFQSGINAAVIAGALSGLALGAFVVAGALTPGSHFPEGYPEPHFHLEGGDCENIQ